MPWLAPEILITAFALILLVIETFFKCNSRTIGWLALIGLIAATVVTYRIGFQPRIETYWSGLYIWDPTAKLLKLFLLASTILVVWLTLEMEPFPHSGRAEFYILTLFALVGMLLLASAIDFMMVFVGLELITVSFYILVAYQRENLLSLEAGVKYLVLGSLASAFLVMGIAYVFGLTGSTQFASILVALRSPEGVVGVAFGLILILIGVGFKISSVPFHWWAPDVYQGAPTPITAFLATASKATGFLILMRVFIEAFGGGAGSYVGVFIVVLKTMAILSLIFGNLAAIPQRNLKRLMGYSSVSHSGFLLIGVASLIQVQAGLVAVLVYLIAYLLATFTALAVIGLMEGKTEGGEIHHYAGLWKRCPLAAGALTLALVSLAGIPPLVGFIGKLGIFIVALDARFYGLFVVGILSSVASLYYYLNVVKVMFWSEPLEEEPILLDGSAKGMLVLLSATLLILGLCPCGISWLMRNLN